MSEIKMINVKIRYLFSVVKIQFKKRSAGSSEVFFCAATQPFIPFIYCHS